MISNIKYTCEEFIRGKGFCKLKARSQQKINEEMYRNIVSEESMSFFRSLGGREKAVRGETKFGYKIVGLESLSPNKEVMILRYFNFDEAIEV